MSVDPRLLEGIRLFNEREFFECHDELEELWTETIGPERDFYQGLIHAAVSLFHFEGSNLGGARKMYGSACAYLSPYQPHYLGVDVTRLLTDMQRCFRDLLGEHHTYPTGVVIDEADIPRIHAEPAADSAESAS